MAQISQELFAARREECEACGEDLPIWARRLAAVLKPDVAIEPATPDGRIHPSQDWPDADIYFVANTDNRPHTFDATFRTERTGAEWWDPFSGKFDGRWQRTIR